MLTGSFYTTHPHTPTHPPTHLSTGQLSPKHWLTVLLAFQPLELLCEKSIGTANRPMGAGEALRRVLECLASGIVMPGWGLVLSKLQGKDRD